MSKQKVQTESLVEILKREGRERMEAAHEIDGRSRASRDDKRVACLLALASVTIEGLEAHIRRGGK